jgi:hypothetical protein
LRSLEEAPVVSAINVVAAASLFIYLTHFNFARLLYRLGSTSHTLPY